MTSKDDDVGKLLGQINLEDFPYRAFGRSETPALRLVRPLVKTTAPAPPAAPSAVPGTQSTPSFSKTSAATASPPRTPEVAVAARLGDAFARLAQRSIAISNAPRLRLQLALPTRQALLGEQHARATSDLPLRALFDRLHHRAIPPRSDPTR